MHKVLSLIIEAKKKQIAILHKTRQEIIALARSCVTRDFQKALELKDQLALIAEIKQASPSAGILRKDLNPEEIAQIYEKSGVQAISVVTEEEFFLGKIKYLQDVRRVTKLPILRKDFIIDEIQLYHSKASGADAVLLIAKILPQERLEKLSRLAAVLGLAVIIEVHTQRELKRVLRLSPKMIGINNRNLDTFEVDLKTTLDLAPFIPKDCCIISESGIHSFEDILLLKGVGVSAVLIGEALMCSPNINQKLKEFHAGATN